jgi:hypothetical protein
MQMLASFQSVEEGGLRSMLTVGCRPRQEQGRRVQGIGEDDCLPVASPKFMAIVVRSDAIAAVIVGVDDVIIRPWSRSIEFALEVCG